MDTNKWWCKGEGQAEEGRRSGASESGVIDSRLPSVAPFRRDRTSNKARLTTLFNNGAARSSLFHPFISSAPPPVLPRVAGFSPSLAPPDSRPPFLPSARPHLIIPTFQPDVKSAPHRKSQITHRRLIHSYKASQTLIKGYAPGVALYTNRTGGGSQSDHPFLTGAGQRAEAKRKKQKKIDKKKVRHQKMPR